MDAQRLFSVILLVRKKNHHLLPLTLDTLKDQYESDFETVLIDGKSSGRLTELIRQYPELHIQIRSSAASMTSEMMNEAVRSVQGRYLQFLDPGDRFISPQSLSYVKELITENGDPDIAYSGFLFRGPDILPYAITPPLTMQILQKGMFSMVSRSSWLLKQSVVELGGFDQTLHYRSSFDLLCRLFLKQGMRAVYSRRVLTDCEPHPASPREVIGYATETCRILYRHFGLWHAMRWIFVQDHLKMCRWTLRLLKQAFSKKANT